MTCLKILRNTNAEYRNAVGPCAECHYGPCRDDRIAANDRMVDNHTWRQPRDGEPREEGAVCETCGAYSNTEGRMPCPISLDAIDKARRLVAAWHGNNQRWNDNPDEDLSQRIAALVKQEIDATLSRMRVSIGLLN